MRCCILFTTLGIGLWAAAQEPVTDCFKDLAASRWLSKKVIASRVLDDMESTAHWTSFTTGAPEVVDARTAQKTTERSQVVAELEVSHERSRDGRPSLRIRMPTRLEVPGPKSGRGWGSVGVRRQFEGEDWRQFNRLSLWVYPDWPGFYVVALELRLYNEGVEKLPAPFGQEGETTVVLRNHEWNHVVWEIGNVTRDNVTRLEVSSLMSGHEPEAADVVTYYVDHLALEKVDPDYVEGWDVWPGRISYSHTGYQSGGNHLGVPATKATDLGHSAARLLLYRPEQGPYPALLPSRPGTSSDSGTNSAVRRVPESPRMDEMVFGGRAVFPIPEGGGKVHRTLRRDAGFHLHGGRVSECA